MFTGIVEEVGTIESVSKSADSYILKIRASRVLEGTNEGDSIAVNGLCLTATRLDGSTFSADVMPESLRRSSLDGLKKGDSVNLERALSLSSRLGGHIVSGHIDGTGTIVKYKKEANAVWITINAPDSIMRYIIEKGSVAIDGVSLTVAAVGDDNFSVSIIPHTGTHTILLQKREGDRVNLENDIIGKYVEKIMLPNITASKKSSSQETITTDFLAKHGFI